MTRFLRNQFIRFVVVGCFNTGFSYSLYALFLWLGLDYAGANFLAFVISLLFSFRTQGALVFQNREPRLLWRFGLAWLAIYVVNVGIISLLIGGGLGAYAAGAVALLPITLLSYLVQKFGVFAKPSAAVARDSTRTSS